jgi:tetratricopeptide (TPR) repeat protein
MAPRFTPSRLRAVTASFLVAAASLALGGCMDQAAEHRTRANAFLRGGDATAALSECDMGLASKKDNVPLLILRGKSLFELERLDDARVDFDKAVALSKGEEPRTLSEAYLGLAMVATRQKDWAAARHQFEMLVIASPKDAVSHLNVARTCVELKDLACAVAQGEEAAHLRGNDEPVLYTLGTIYVAADKLQDAEATFQHICEIIPGAATCPYGLSIVAAKKGDKARALAQLQEAVNRKLPNPQKIPSEAAFAAFKDDPEFQKIAERAKQE